MFVEIVGITAMIHHNHKHIMRMVRGRMSSALTGWRSYCLTLHQETAGRLLYSDISCALCSVQPSPTPLRTQPNDS